MILNDEQQFSNDSLHPASLCASTFIISSHHVSVIIKDVENIILIYYMHVRV